MSDRMLWRYGETNPVVTKPVGTATVIEIGDLIFQDASDNTPKPASAFTWASALAATQNGFQDRFLGVAEQRSRSGDTDPIRVATTGVFEFDCASASFELGALVGPAKASGNALEDQKVAAVAFPTRAIARVNERTSSKTTVLCRIFSSIMGGGVQAIETVSSSGA